MPANLDLRQITPDNETGIRALSVSDAQRRFVATVDKSLADAYVWKDACFRAAYLDGEPVGYVMIFPFEKDNQQLVNIVRLMIDQRYQSRGLGRALLGATLSWIDTLRPAADRVRISTLPDNRPALSLYQSVGFELHGTEDGELALYLDRHTPSVPATASGTTPGTDTPA